MSKKTPVIGSGLLKSKEPVTGNLMKGPTGIGNEAMVKYIFKIFLENEQKLCGRHFNNNQIGNRVILSSEQEGSQSYDSER